MRRPRVTSQIGDLTATEWEQVTLAAVALARAGVERGTVILPRRSGLFRLERVGRGRYRLRAGDYAGLADAVTAELRQRREAAS